MLWSASAQISTKEKPTSFSIARLRSISTLGKQVLPKVDLGKLQREDAETDALGIAPRFGYPHKVVYTLENSGEWTTLEDGGRIWRLILRCPEALSINLLYNRFWLPEGGKLFLYTPDEVQTIGAFTSYNNTGTREAPGGFATSLLFGDEVVVEYYEPRAVRGQGIIDISTVVHGYRYVNHRQYNSSGNGHKNINCPEGANWQKEKNAVAIIYIDGHRFCTGALVNNTNEDGEALFLTADHCTRDENNNYSYYSDVVMRDTWLFGWHYESPDCDTPTQEPPMYTTAGANLLARNPDSDFALFRLRENPKDHTDITPYYLGWDRSAEPPTGVVGIHHPKGDIKKISLASQTLDIDPYIRHWRDKYQRYVSTTQANCLWTFKFDIGLTEPGSSGSPLLNRSGRLVGQLTGGTPLGTVYYGRLYKSWDGNGKTSPLSSLSSWLDPANTGQESLGGLDGSENIDGERILCDERSYALILNPPGAQFHWSANNDNIQLVSGQGTRFPTFRSVKFGKTTIKAHITLPNGVAHTAIKEVYSSPSWSPSTPPSHTYADAYTRTMEMVRPNLPALPSGLNWSDLQIRRDTYPHYLNDVEFSMVGDAVKVVTGFQEGDAQAHIYLKTPCQEVLLGSLRVSVTHRNSGGGGLGPIVVYSVGRTLHVLQQEANVATATGLRSLSVPKLRGEVPLTTSSSAPYEVQVWDDSHMVKRHFSAEPHLRLSLEGLSSGLHIVQVLQHGKVVATEKIVLE